jgi:hypothetical protein
MNTEIIQYNNNLILLENNIKTDYANINNLFLLYKEFIKFIILLKIYELNRWQILKKKYKELKNIIRKNKLFYSSLLKNYEIIYKYMVTDEIENNNNKINQIKSLIDNNNYYLYNLQKEHKFTSIKLLNFIKDTKIYKINYIHNDIKNIINHHYDKINYIKKIINNYNIIKKKIKQTV